MPTVASETPEPSIAYRLHASELIANPLFDAIPRRRTNRLSYRDEPVARGNYVNWPISRQVRIFASSS